MKELIEIQSTLKAPKNQKNNFGNYMYRSAEDIVEAVKPILHKVGCSLTITDDIVMVGDRIYVKATAILKNSAGDVEYTSAFAREPSSKKGYDDSQVTGSTSSYARKYALNGLFCIDDTKDADATNNGDKSEDKKSKSGVTIDQKAGQQQSDVNGCPSETYWKLVKMAVEGRTMKSGITPLQYLKVKFKVSADAVKRFEADVAKTKDARDTQDFLDLDESAQNPKNKINNE